MEIEDYEGRLVYADAEERGERCLSKRGLVIDECSSDRIVARLLSRPYLRTDELNGEYPSEAVNWEISCSVVIEIDDGTVAEIWFDDRVWGDDGLGDFDSQERLTEDEAKTIVSVAKQLLKAITVPEAKEDVVEQCTSCGCWATRLKDTDSGDCLCKRCFDEQ